MRAFESERTANTSQFEVALRERLNPGWENECNSLDCRYPPHVNFNTFFVDLNGDGLPDLVTASSPQPWINSANAKGTVCEDGHDVYLNRGYTFESTRNETGNVNSWNSTAPDHPFNKMANRDRFCSNTRPAFLDRSTQFFTAPPEFPVSAMAQADLDGDGRVDIVLAHQQLLTDLRNAAVAQVVYRNTGRGFKSGIIAIPPDVAVSRNTAWAGVQPAAAGEWPRVGSPDRARFVDLDNDGLVDIVVAGDCVRRNVVDLDCVPAHWYRNAGEIPDRLVRISSATGAWTTIEYASPKSGIVETPDGGLHPPASMRVVKTIRSAAGPVPAPAGFDPFPIAETRLSYENFVKDLVTNETVGFEKVKAEFVNRFDTAPRETVSVTQTFDVRPQVADASGALLQLRHPLRGTLASTMTESGGWTALDLEQYSLEARGAGVRIRPRREIHGDATASGTAWSARETTELDPYGFPVRSVTGDWDGTSIVGRARTTVRNYDHRADTWLLGLVTRESLFGYAEDIVGTPKGFDPLSAVATTYDFFGRVTSTSRLGIRGGTCDGPNDDLTTFEYRQDGLVSVVHELAVHDPETGVTHTRDVTTTYQAHDLYPASVSVRAGKLVAGDFVPGQTTLTTAFITDHRTGQNIEVARLAARARSLHTTAEAV